MRVRSILSEAFRNVLSGIAWPALLPTLFVLLCGMLGALEAASVNGILRDGDNFLSAGSATYILAAKNGVDGLQCERLNHSPDVLGAGASREREGVRLTALPLSGTAMNEVSPGYLRAIATATGRRMPAGTGVLLPGDLAGSLGVVPGGHLEASSGRLTVAGTFDYPDDGRDPALSNAILGVVPADNEFDECWLTAWPSSPAVTELLRTALSGSFPAGGDVSIRQLNAKYGERFAGSEMFDERPTRFSAPLAFGLMAMVSFFGVWLRRLALASDRHAGVRRGDQLAQLLVEAAVWLSAGMVVFSSSALILYAAGITPFFVTHLILGIGLAGVGGAGAGVVLAWSAIREKQIFVYFKQR